MTTPHNTPYIWYPDIPARIQQTRDAVRSGRIAVNIRERLLDEARLLSDASLELKKLGNDCVPLLRMPPEIVGHIVDVLADIWPPHGVRRVEQNGIPLDACSTISLGWILMGQICHRLREILLSRHSIWARSVCSLPSSQVMKHILSRCGDAPLNLLLENTQRGATVHPATFAFALQHLPRARQFVIREFFVALSHSSHLVAIEPALFSQNSLPHLERLELTLIRTPERSGILTPDVCELPSMTAPRLKSLYLRNIIVSFPPSNLTELSLIFDHPTYLYTPTQFFDILRQCTQLQLLHLKSCIALLSKGILPAISMPSLRHLKISDDANRCLGLWNHLVVPPSAVVSLDLNAVRNTFTGGNSHVEVVSAIFRNSDVDQPASGLSIWDVGIKNTAVVLLKEQAGVLSTTWTGVFREGFTEQYHLWFHDIAGEPPHFMQLLSRALHAANPSNITALEIRSTFAYDPSAWSTSLAPFTQVRTLYIEAMPRPAMLLSLIAPEQDDNSENTLILPNLQFLWLSELNLRDLGDGLALDRFSFSRIFSSRNKRGAQVKHLRIEELVLDRTLAESVVLPRLRALVPLVECDVMVVD